LDVLADTVRDGLVRRESKISVNYKGSSYEGVVKKIFAMALDETGVPTEGDYLKFQYDGYGCAISGTVDSGIYYVTFDYTVSYYTTEEQENVVNDAVETLIEELKLSSYNSEYEKINVIYDYICKNITYDYEHLEDESYKLKATAYAALINKTAVCQGYANLFYRLTKEVGIDARIMKGNAVTVATSEPGPHAWNIVKVDGKYYLLDATWDAGKDEYDYFLKGSSDFDEADDRYVHVLDEEYLTEEFTDAYPIAETSYINKENAEAIELIDDFSISADSYLFTGKEIKPVVTSETYVKDEDYTVTYENNIESGTAKVIITGINDYSGTITKEFEIVFFEYSFDQTGSNKIIIEEVSDNVTGHLEIPERLEGYAIIGIDDEAFKDCKKLTSITMPQPLTTIGMNAFNGCTALTEVTFTLAEETVGASPFCVSVFA